MHRLFPRHLVNLARNLAKEQKRVWTRLVPHSEIAEKLLEKDDVIRDAELQSVKL